VSSKRQRIVDAVKARFAAISVAGGYLTELGGKQTEWHPAAKGPDDRPGHDVRDLAEETVVEDRNKGLYERKLLVQVVAEVAESDATAANARAALADMIRAVGVDPTWGGLARYSLPVEDEVTVDEEAQRVGGARLVFEVVYSRKPWEA
jgi:hypothetical protein